MIQIRHVCQMFALIGLMFSSVHSFAQSSLADGVLINADTMFRDLEKKTVRLKGNVQIVFKGQHLSCDKALLDLQKQLVTAEGHIILYNEKVHVEGDRLVFNYRENTGFIYNGFVQSGQVVFEGEVVEKIGEDRYLASNAAYTACETCPPGWSFSGSKIDAQIGGYARIQRPIFRIAGVPVLILPSLIVPLKSARQSGVLVPSMDFSAKGGLALSGIYFWAIDRSQDVTLTARWYEKRGYKALEDYRYVLNKNSQGRLRGAFMEDRRLQKDYPTPPIGNVDRWFVTYDHYQELPNEYVHRANINQVSDLRYVQDFPEEILGNGDPALENKVSITKSGDNQYASAEVDVYQNLLKTYPLQPNDDAVHRFPEIKYSYKETRLFEYGPLVRMDMDYTNFARSKWSYDDLVPCASVAGPDAATVCPTNDYRVPRGSVLVTDPVTLQKKIQLASPRGEIQRDGNFNSATDLQRTGQRLDLQPTISYPFQIAKKFDLMPSVTYRETQYRFNFTDPGAQADFDNTAARRYMQTDLKAKTEFSRVFGDMDDPKATRWKHTIQPEVGYSYIPWMRRPNHPFFGDFRGLQYARQYDPISDSDIGNSNTGVQFDYNDRTFERRVVNYAIDNRITRKLFNDGMVDYKTLTLFRLSQSYDFNEASRSNGGQPSSSHPWSSIDALLDMRFEHFDT
ncbi:MAG: LPS-assembly protein LptD, partial [Bdellovibrionales bacterium]